MAQLVRLQPDVVVLSVDANPVEPDSGDEVDAALERKVRTGLDDTVSSMSAAGGRLVMLGDIPGLAQWPGGCLATRGATLLGCAAKPSRLWRDEIAMSREIAQAHHDDFINPYKWFCADHLCPAVIGSMVTYRDAGHMTTVYSHHLAGALAGALRL
jgi:hypothetical protein